MTDPENFDDDEALAAEYVLHVLDPEDRVRFEARLLYEAPLRALVHQWEAHLATLAETVDEETPSPAVRAALVARFGQDKPQAGFARRWFRPLAALAVAAMVAVFIFGPMLRAPAELTPAFQAELASEDQTLVLRAGVIPATHEIVIDYVAGQAPAGRVLELWLIAEGADVPVSLGLLQDSGTTRIRVPDPIAPSVRTGTIAISEEPPGGSPTGAPTGQVLAAGTFVDV